jgi:hypothetical protein
MVENEIIIMGAFLGTGLLAYMIIPGLLVMWDRVPDPWNQEMRTKNSSRQEDDPPANHLF